MARIPLGSFGNAIAQPKPGVKLIPAAFDNGGEALAKAAGGVYDSLKEAAKQQREEEEKLSRARAANAVLDREIQLRTLQNDIATRLDNGELQHDNAIEAYDAATQFLDTPEVGKLDPATKERFGGALKQVSFMSREYVSRVASNAKQVEFRGQTDSALDKLGKLAGMPGADVESVAAKVDLLDAPGRIAYGGAWGRKKQEFRDRAWQNEAAQRFVGVQDNMDGLRAMENDLTQGHYLDKLDANVRVSQLASVKNQIGRLHARQDLLAERDTREAERALSEYEQYVDTGQNPPAEVRAAWWQKIAGKPQESEFRRLQSDEAEITRLRTTMTLPEQKVWLDGKSERLSKAGTLREREHVGRLARIFDANLKAVRENPLGFIENQTGVAFDPISPADMLGDGQTSGAQLRYRASMLRALQSKNPGTVPMKPFAPDEVAVYGTMLMKAPPETRSEIFGLIYKAFGSDSEAYTGAVNQIARGDALLAMAGIAKGRGFKSQDGHDVGDLLLRGHALLADKSFAMPKDTSGEDATLPIFNRLIGGAIPPGMAMRDSVHQASRAIYAELARQAGYFDGILNQGLFRQAIDLATGGMYEHAGGKVLKPYGMPDEKFADTLDEQLVGIAKSHNLPLGGLRELPLVPGKREGRYYLQSGRNYLRGGDGKPLEVIVR